MAVENANLTHALATLDLQDPPSIVAGFGVASLTRTAVGQYRVTLVEPVDEGGGQAWLAAAALELPPNTARITLAVIQPLAGGPNNIELVTANHNGTLTDIGRCYFKVLRYPT